MAQTYTLEEAAQRLGVTPEEMKRRLKEDWKTLRSFRDGPTMRFRAPDIDELARSLGAASDPGLPLAPMGQGEEPGSDDFKLPQISQPTPDQPLVFDSSADEDIFSLSAEEPPPAAKAAKGDSDVRLEAEKPKAPKGDSDVRLEGGKGKAAKGQTADPAAIPTEEISLDVSGPGSAVIKGGSSAKLSAPKSSSKLTGPDSGKSLSSPGTGTGDSSEFELSLDADSDDFDLQLNTDSSDEVELGAMPKDKGKGRPGESGILSRNPNDSGPSLENKKKPAAEKPKAEPAAIERDSDDFELSLDAESSSSDSSISPISGPKSGKLPVTSDSDSEFELTLDDSSASGSSLEHAAMEGEEEAKGDIFETDFEIPPMADDSGSEAVALESDTDIEKSDFDLALDDSDVIAEEETGSEVVAIDDDGGVVLEEATDTGDVDLADSESDADASSVSGTMRRLKPTPGEEDEEAVVPAGVARRVPWGPVPVLLLFPAFLILILGGLTAYDLLHTMWGYQQPRKPSATIVQAIAEQFKMKLEGQ